LEAPRERERVEDGERGGREKGRERRDREREREREREGEGDKEARDEEVRGLQRSRDRLGARGLERRRKRSDIGRTEVSPRENGRSVVPSPIR